MHLAKYARAVTLLVRGDSFAKSMSSYLVRAIESTPNVVVRHRTEVVDGAGDGPLESIKLADRANDTVEEVSAAALFIMIGGEPHTQWLPEEIARDAQGYLITGRDLLEQPELHWKCDREPLTLAKLTMKYPSIYLLGERAHGEVLSIAFAGAGQHQDAGAKIIHAGPNTTSNIFAKSIAKDGGRGSYRGLLEIAKGAHGSRSKVVCDALLLDEHSRSDTYPTIRIGDDDVNVGHEATVSKVGEEQLFYLMSHGIPEDEASKLIVNGFVEPIIKELPMEYAVEMNRLIELQMESSIG